MNLFDLARVPLYSVMADNGTVIVFDTETTGLTDNDDVVQLAVVAMRKRKELFSKAVYLKNQVPIDGTEAQKINGITDELLRKSGLDPVDVLSDFLTLIEKTISEEGMALLVAHNLSFDYRMIVNMMRKYGIADDLPERAMGCCTKEFVKSLQLPKSILPGNHLRNCIRVFQLDAKNSHDALDDAKACWELFNFLTKE